MRRLAQPRLDSTTCEAPAEPVTPSGGHERVFLSDSPEAETAQRLEILHEREHVERRDAERDDDLAAARLRRRAGRTGGQRQHQPLAAAGYVRAGRRQQPELAGTQPRRHAERNYEPVTRHTFRRRTGGRRRRTAHDVQRHARPARTEVAAQQPAASAAAGHGTANARLGLPGEPTP